MKSIAAVLLGFAPAIAAATAVGPVPAAPIQLETTLVTGVQPGPGLWRVEQGEHVLWLLGTQSPLPKRMEWRSDEVERLVAEADELLTGASVTVDADIGMFGALALLPAAYGARKNPDDKRLAEVVPAALYQRWLPLKQRYLGRGRKVESWRPLFAADKLYDEAIEEIGLRVDDQVLRKLKKIAKRHDVPVTTPTHVIKLSKPKETLQRFRDSEVDDLACFETTVARLETDLDAMRERANAWAVGDIERLRELPYPDNRAACNDALNRAMLDQGMGDAQALAQQKWLEVATASLQNNRTTVAVVSIEGLLAEDGVLNRLRQRGYRIVEPE